MDAHALLKSQGWRGHGHTLHHTSNSIGLAKPLLISRNTDGRGIGTKQHYTSDQWWLDAFDQKLKGLDTSKDGTVTQTVTTGKLDVIASGVKQGKYTGAKGLYACFVRGEMLDGSRSAAEESGASTPASTEGLRKETKEERRIRKEEKRKRKEHEKRKKKEEKKVAKKAAKLLIKASETKEERKERRKERRVRKKDRRERGDKGGKNGSG
jgi:nucleolar protein TMA23